MSNPASELSATFGPFTLIPSQLLLLDGQVSVRLGSRALVLLCALVERAGEVMSRAELVAKVWPTTVVEETSLRVQVAALRKVLGEGQRSERYIVNVVGRGYSFVAPVQWRPWMQPAATPAQPAARHHVPTRITRAIGRDEVVAALSEQISRRRLVSIVGPGGIGKTTVALAVAETALGSFRDGIFFVDLAPLSEQKAMLATLLTTLTISAPIQDATVALQNSLRQRHTLLVFDNCEHLVDGVARLVDELIRMCPSLHVLATSREPLNLEGEWVHRQRALDTPDPTESLSVAQAFAYSAVQLFVERATACTDTFALSDTNLDAVRQVCCRLDGMPLAIELAAGRVQTLGVHEIAGRLDNVFGLLNHGRRSAEPRHRALKAMLDWSHDLLSDDERKVLRRLAIFRASFTLDAACHVVGDEALHSSDVIAHLLSLVDKSLVTVDTHSDVAHYRLLYATRKFGGLQLAAHGEASTLAQRHAQYLQDLLESKIIPPEAFDTDAARALLERSHADVQAAIVWALSEPDMLALAVRLTLMSISNYESLDSGLSNIERAMARVEQLEPSDSDLNAQLVTAWCMQSGLSNAMGSTQTHVFARMNELIPRLERELHARCFQSMSVGAFGQGDYPASLQYAERLASYGDLPMAARQSERMRALNLHFLGRHPEARPLAQTLIDEVLTIARAPLLASARRAFSMRLVMARILWIHGHVDQAVAMSEAAQQESADANPFARCKALGLAAIPIALWTGDLESASVANRQLSDLSTRHAIGYWQSWTEHFDKIIAARFAGVKFQVSTPGDVARQFPASNATEVDALPTFAEELLTERSLARIEQGEVGWCAPETWRAHGMALLTRGGPASQVDAAAAFERSLELSRSQGALSWELRAACSLARLWKEQGRSLDAHRLLAPTLARFTEGGTTADLVAAQLLLKELSVPADATART